jgi:hypothetical protein
MIAVIPAMIAMEARLISTVRKRYFRNDRFGVVLEFSDCSVAEGVGLTAPTTWLGDVSIGGDSASLVAILSWIDGGITVGVGVGDEVGVGVKVGVGVTVGVGVLVNVGVAVTVEVDTVVERIPWRTWLYVLVGVGQLSRYEGVGLSPIP